MSGHDEKVRPKRYGLLKGQIEIPKDFDAPLEPGEFDLSEDNVLISSGQAEAPTVTSHRARMFEESNMPRIWKATRPEGKRQPITTLEEWERFAGPKRSIQWVPGRSAMEAAVAWLECGDSLPSEVTELLEPHADFGPILDWHAEPEAKLRFDEFKGEPRNSDLAVYVQDRHGPYLIAVEAKADEPFGEPFSDALAAAAERFIANQASKGVARAMQLATMLFGPRRKGEPAIGKLRYQLMTAVAGALSEAERQGFGRVVMLVHEFVTDATRDERHERNAIDLAAFVSRLTGGVHLELMHGQLVGPLGVPGKTLKSAAPKLYVGKVRRNIRTGPS